MQNITLRRTQSHWLRQWSPDGKRFYNINHDNMRFPPNSAVEHSTDYGRTLLNAMMLGLLVRVRGTYNKETKILGIQP